MQRNLILSGGIFHDFTATSATLAERLTRLDIQSRIEDDIETGLRSLASQPVDLLTINALRWEMQGSKYDPYRASEALTLSDEGQQAIEQHLQQGGALLGLHTASICFSNWPVWGDILGGVWRWGQSWHPAPAAVKASPLPHALTAGLPSFTVTDELYTDLEVANTADILLMGSSPAVDEPQPVMWCHHWHNGRIVYDALGHAADALSEPSHWKVLERSINWAMGRDS